MEGLKYMKKAVVITLHYVNNFGSVLQTYATQSFFENIGFQTSIANYVRDNYRFEYLAKDAYKRYRKRKDFFSLPPIAFILYLRWRFIYKKQTRVFNSFRKKYLNISPLLSSLDSLASFYKHYDLYVVGSDQVWNYEYNSGHIPEYFLEFAPVNARKLSFSSSFGLNSINEEMSVVIRNQLSSFSGISVREENAVKMLNDIGIKNAVHVLDPTLLISKDEWTSKMSLNKKRNINEKYIFLYQLNKNEEMDSFAYDLAKDNNLKLIVVSSHCSLNKKANVKRIKQPTVFDFLNLILYADYVVTDSFHGTAFSINFHKNFYSFLPPKYGSRIESILKILDLEKRLITKQGKTVDTQSIDYIPVEQFLAKNRKNTKEFVLNSIGEKDE